MEIIADNAKRPPKSNTEQRHKRQRYYEIPLVTKSRWDTNAPSSKSLCMPQPSRSLTSIMLTPPSRTIAMDASIPYPPSPPGGKSPEGPLRLPVRRKSRDELSTFAFIEKVLSEIDLGAFDSDTDEDDGDEPSSGKRNEDQKDV